MHSVNTAVHRGIFKDGSNCWKFIEGNRNKALPKISFHVYIKIIMYVMFDNIQKINKNTYIV